VPLLSVVREIEGVTPLLLATVGCGHLEAEELAADAHAGILDELHAAARERAL